MQGKQEEYNQVSSACRLLPQQRVVVPSAVAHAFLKGGRTGMRLLMELSNV